MLQRMALGESCGEDVCRRAAVVLNGVIYTLPTQMKFADISGQMCEQEDGLNVQVK